MSTAETTDRQNSESVQASSKQSSGPRIVFVSHEVVNCADEGYHQHAARELPKFRR